MTTCCRDITLSTEAAPSYARRVASKKQAAEDDRQGLMLRLPKELHSALRHLSIDRKESLNALITTVLEDWWSRQPERERYADPPRPRKRGASVV